MRLSIYEILIIIFASPEFINFLRDSQPMRKPKEFFVYSMFVLGLGSVYTLARKYQNLQQSMGPDGVLSYFHQPM